MLCVVLWVLLVLSALLGRLLLFAAAAAVDAAASVVIVVVAVRVVCMFVGVVDDLRVLHGLAGVVDVVGFIGVAG